MRWDNEEDEDEGGEGEGLNRDIDTTTLCPVRAIPAWRKLIQSYKRWWKRFDSIQRTAKEKSYRIRRLWQYLDKVGMHRRFDLAH